MADATEELLVPWLVTCGLGDLYVHVEVCVDARGEQGARRVALGPLSQSDKRWKVTDARPAKVERGRAAEPEKVTGTLLLTTKQRAAIYRVLDAYLASEDADPDEGELRTLLMRLAPKKP